ncbi:MAG: hypothetical protein IJ123_09475 [Blautia sp.]|nr:hypothetical protein [Blautia sp.]
MNRVEHVFEAAGICSEYAVRTVFIFVLVTALLFGSAAVFVLPFSGTDFCEDSCESPAAAISWTIRSGTLDSHPLEAVKDEEVSLLSLYQLSLYSHNANAKAWYLAVRMVLMALMAAAAGFCSIPAHAGVCPVRWVSSTCSHTYIISYIFRLSSRDRSSLRW